MFNPQYLISSRPHRAILFQFLLILISLTACHLAFADSNSVKILVKARLDYGIGNYKDAYEGYRQEFLLPESIEAANFDTDLSSAVYCLSNLGRIDELDEFLEAIVSKNSESSLVLASVARIYSETLHYGDIVAGKFNRGSQRGQGRTVDSSDRDRVRSLQLLMQALAVKTEINGFEENNQSQIKANLYRQLAGVISRGEESYSAWKLQSLTDISKLPDYSEYQYGYRGSYFGSFKGAPVKQDGFPVYYIIPNSFEDAINDGERWRWAMNQEVKNDPSSMDRVQFEFAQFLKGQFDVRSMQQYDFHPVSHDSDTRKDESGTYAVHSLEESETIARLASGIKRFKLPDEFNFIKILQSLAAKEQPASVQAEAALGSLVETFLDRRQYERAAEYLKQSLRDYGPGPSNSKQLQLTQILGAWGRFEAVQSQDYLNPNTVDYVFRNGSSVKFDAFEIDTDQLISDAKTYLQSNPGQMTWDKIQIENIGYRLVRNNETKYIGEKAASWTQALDPDSRHFDRRVTIQTPLKKAGAYLINATISGGNKTSIVLWINDTVILRKPLDQGIYFYLADAHSGKPLSNTNVEFFGYKQQQKKTPGIFDRAFKNIYEIITSNVVRRTDDNGQIILSSDQIDSSYSWLVSSSRLGHKSTYLGFDSIWFSQRIDSEYNQTKAIVITDRPVYRPENNVKFKIWVRNAKYDEDDSSSYANKNFTVEVHDPKGNQIWTSRFQSDSYGGIEGNFDLKKDSTLGVYNLSVNDSNFSQNGDFRVEEYKKPEFEIKINAPSTPVALGEKIKVGIDAHYYFGAPVSKGIAKYKVLRSDYNAQWYPSGVWDWFYGKGYWWFACDYFWYPGFKNWAIFKPISFWINRSAVPPEIILESEQQIAADGKLEIEIDTAIAKEIHPDSDHRYEISVEVTDESRHSVFGSGEVLVAKSPFKVYAWVDRGYYKVGDSISADFSAQTLDGKPVEGKGTASLYNISYKEAKPTETLKQQDSLSTDSEGRAHMQFTAAHPGQYRLSYTVTDSAGRSIEGGYIFNVRGAEATRDSFRFNDIEIIPDKREYSPGEKAKLLLNTSRENSTVLYFLRPSNGVYLAPEILTLKSKSSVQEINITKKDMPNFFVEAVTVADGKIYSETKEIIVPPASRVLNLDLESSKEEYRPGEEAELKFKLSDAEGNPFQGSTVLTVYDKAVEYISGGSNVPEIKEFFWKWRRSHYPSTQSNVDAWSVALHYASEVAMDNLGVFGASIADEFQQGLSKSKMDNSSPKNFRQKGGPSEEMKDGLMSDEVGSAAPMAVELERDVDAKKEMSVGSGAKAQNSSAPKIDPVIRKDFADTAFWSGSINTDSEGRGSAKFKMPENLTDWKIRTWAMGHGTKVAQAEKDVVTKKNLLIRLQAPRFFVEKDEVVLSANVHNYLKTAKEVSARLEFVGDNLELLDPAEQKLSIEPGVDKRIDWRVRVNKEGQAVVRALALTDEESDAVEMKFPVFVHGMLKTESWSGFAANSQDAASFEINVPTERRVEQTQLEIRYSPSLAAAMVDALPYLVSYPYGCTEQTLNRFIPTAITQKILKEMGLNLSDIRQKRSNLNAQEIGADKDRAKQWKRYDENPVFDEDEVSKMLATGINRLQAMQLSDGGWGWFSGNGEQSWAHTTAVVVHGFQIAKEAGVPIPENILTRGIEWLKHYQASEIQKLKNAGHNLSNSKSLADDLDSFVYMVLVDAAQPNSEMLEFLYRDRLSLSVYTQAMFGLALERQEFREKLEVILQNLSQYVVQDDENQTAYLKLPDNNYWWSWYGSEYEAQSYYLKLLARTDAKSIVASRLVKYLLNNRKNATYWNSTRDSAIVVEAFAEYLRATAEMKPDLKVGVFIDGKLIKEVQIKSDNLFTFDNKVLLQGLDLSSGKHKVEFRKSGKGPLYFNAYLTNFTLEDRISRAGLEVKVNRKFYKLNRVDSTALVQGARGQSVNQNVEKYERSEIADLATVKSGDLVEVELEIDSKNDYEYIMFEDMKAAGFEPVEVRSGYNGNDMGAYVEFRDERVGFFIRSLARGKHSVSYRLKAEIPGSFSALPARAYAMYAPELKGNSDEFKIGVVDSPSSH